MDYISDKVRETVIGIIGLNYKISEDQIKPEMNIDSLPCYTHSDMAPLLNAISSSFGNIALDLKPVFSNEPVKIKHLMGVAREAYVRKVFFETINEVLGLLAWVSEVKNGVEIQSNLFKEGYSWESPLGEVKNGLGADSTDSILLVQELEKKLASK